MFDRIEYLQRAPWQMTYGERSALEGIVAGLRPEIAVEIGTAEGGSLKTIAAYSGEVHSFDLVAPQNDAAELPNVTIHPGDSHVTVPAYLAELDAVDRAVDFVLIDGDHTVEGVRRDTQDVLNAACTRRSVIIFHDTANDDVRAGIEAADWSGATDFVYVDLDFVPGYAVTSGVYDGAFWGGLGIAIRDADGGGRLPNPPFLPAPEALKAWRAARAGGAGQQSAGEEARLREENAQLRHWLESTQGSVSWKLTSPLRAAKRRLGR